jgi:hypothetical protein
VRASKQHAPLHRDGCSGQVAFSSLGTTFVQDFLGVAHDSPDRDNPVVRQAFMTRRDQASRTKHLR